MRGLDIRLKFAIGRVVASIFGEDQADERWESVEAAIALGHYDFQGGYGYDNPPGMFRDTPELLEAWRTGWDDADTSEEIRHCPTCQSTESVFCPAHG